MLFLRLSRFFRFSKFPDSSFFPKSAEALSGRFKILPAAKAPFREIVLRVDFKESLQIAYSMAEISAKRKLEPLKCAENSSIDSIPMKKEIAKFQEKLREEYRLNPEFKRYCDEIYREIPKQNPSAVIINGKLPKGSNPNINKFSSLLFWAAFLKNFGFEIDFSEDGRIFFNDIKSDKIGVAPHQDVSSSYGGGELVLAENLVLINGYSDSKVRTLLMESEVIFNELKKRGYFELLTKQKFTIPASEGRPEITDHLIIKEDENGDYHLNGFFSNAQYLPNAENEQDEESAIQAIKALREIISDDSKKIFCNLNNNGRNGGAQLLIVSNKYAVHEREIDLQIRKSLPSLLRRQVFALDADSPEFWRLARNSKKSDRAWAKIKEVEPEIISKSGIEEVEPEISKSGGAKNVSAAKIMTTEERGIGK